MKRDPKGKFSRVDKEFYGIYTDDKNYLRISAGPLRGVRVATLVLEAKLGRKLEHDEDCHHRDGNKLNCHPDNLEALGHKEHGAVSNKQRMFLKAKEEHDRKEWGELHGKKRA
jgi:hypothetical protein